LRFIDSSVFLHAFLRPRRELTGEEQRVKEEAKEIITGVEEGEEVATSTVHLSEVLNIVESGLGLQRSLGLLAWAVSMPNVEVHPVSLGDYEGALPVAREGNVSVNDALAYQLMEEHGLDEVYSFDGHFNQLRGITRLPLIHD
jgi:predicted nucleic acid-binding protein